MTPQTPAGGSEPSVLPPAGLPTETHWRIAADAVTGHLLEVDRVRAVAEAIAEAEHHGRVAVLRPFEALFAGGPDTACRTTWRRAPGDTGPGATTARVECVEVPMADLRAAFDLAQVIADIGPVFLAELLNRTADDPEWQWETCIGCGKPTAHRGLTILPSGEIKRIGWCDQLSCDTDRTFTDYLEVTT